jgi:hypothetical protein
VVTASADGYISNATSVSYSTPGTVFKIVLSALNADSGNYLPVNVVDATTSANVANSDLNVGDLNDKWWNRTSATGKFNVTGHGPGGLTPLNSGDTLILEGQAPGYTTNGYAIAVDSKSIGVTQYVALAPSSITPKSGEFTLMANAYDDDTTTQLSGVVISLKGGNSTAITKSTNTAGVAVFTNLTAGNTYTATASKSGYSTISKTVTGGSAAIVSLDIPMSSSSVNPTATATTSVGKTSTVTAKATGVEGAADTVNDHAGDLVALFVFAIFAMVGAMIARAWKII